MPVPATVANVAASVASVTLLANNSQRRGALIFNDCAASLRIKFGSDASATSFSVKIPAGGIFSFPEPAYTGVVAGIWPFLSNASGFARVTEMT